MTISGLFTAVTMERTVFWDVRLTVVPQKLLYVFEERTAQHSEAESVLVLAGCLVGLLFSNEKGGSMFL
jgi:hypothetical protein